MLTFYDLKEWAKKKGVDVSSINTNEKLQLQAKLLVQDMVIRTGGFWLYDEYTFSSVASTGTYAFPSRYWKSLILFDTTNENEIDHIASTDEKYNIDRSNATPWGYSLCYRRQVQAQPSTASKVNIISTNTNDTSANGHTFVVRGLDSNSLEIGESLNMNGTTTVQSSNTYAEIWTASKGGTRITTGRYTSNGQYTLSAGATTLVILSIYEDSREHQWVRLHNTPDAVINYRLHFVRKPKNVTRDYDNLDIPESFENAALLGFEWYVKSYLLDRRDDKTLAMYVDELQRVSEFEAKHYDERIVHGAIDSMQDIGLYTPPMGYISRRA